MPTATAAKLITNPFVLRCAWQKAEAWYASVEWAPEPEWTQWKQDPWSHLVALADSIVDGSYRPSAMRQVPYPKQGGEIRHYVIPTVRDQIAHLIYATLLAPFVEARLANVNFGSRWFRGLRRDHTGERPRWVSKPYSLADTKLYNPYNRDYGLFRRLASWVAEDLTGGVFHTALDADGIIQRDEYPSLLRPYIEPSYFQLERPESGRACFARLDLKKAYPSIHRRTVREALLALIDTQLPSGAPDMAGRWSIAQDLDADSVGLPECEGSESPTTLEHPWHILAGQRGARLRREIARSWMQLLDAATYISVDGELEMSAVVPGAFSSREQVHSSSFGIPTGLAVSPMLLNIALYSVDYAILRYLENQSTREALPGAYLRFADDIIILARDAETLTGVISEMEHELAAFRSYGPERRPQINWSKVRPDSVARWGQETDRTVALTLSYTDFIDRDRPGEFVTYLVEHMSTLAFEGITERRGTPARDRLARLHELARWDIKDVEVRKDTRLAYVANRLARAWLPLPERRAQDEPVDPYLARRQRQAEVYRSDVMGIQRMLRGAILETPFKFGLWRSALYTALRVDVNTTDDQLEEPRPTVLTSGVQWLQELLQLIAVGGQWEETWPSSDSPAGLRQVSSHQTENNDSLAIARWEQGEASGFRIARTSFIRAHFWRELAAVIRQLERARASGADLKPSVYAWYARVWGPHHINRCLEALCSADAWASVLYAQRPGHLPAWEREAILIALAACNDCHPISIQRAEANCAGLSAILQSEDLGTDNTLASIVMRFSRRGASLDADISVRLRALADRPDLFTNESSILILQEAIGAFEDQWDISFRSRLTRPHHFFRMMHFYQCLRQTLIEHEAPPAQLARVAATLGNAPPPLQTTIGNSGSTGGPRPALIRALWGRPQPQNVRLALWHVQPTRVPTLGLPVPWTIKIFRDLWTGRKPQDMRLVPEAVFTDSWAPVVADHRRHWLSDSFRRRPHEADLPNNTAQVGTWNNEWTVLPHVASFIPDWLGWPWPVARRWHAVLNLFLAIEGNERFLDSTWRTFPGAPPWTENLRRRCEQPLPLFMWHLIDHGLRNFVPPNRVSRATQGLETIASNADLMASGSDEYVTSISIESAFPVTDLSEYLLRTSGADDDATVEDLQRNLRVRIAQVAAPPLWHRVLRTWPVPPSVCEDSLDQIEQAIDSIPARRAQDSAELIVFPELVLHAEDANDIARYAASKGAGVLSGLFWREIPPPFKPATDNGDPDHLRYFANEALLSIPNFKEPKRAFPYVFRIRKPRPATIEYGLQQSLTASQVPVNSWLILPGQEWVRFVHPAWGPFAVAICSDLLDVAPWARLKGEIIHLFLTAWNPDIDLYDAMTWTRAFELFVNVINVNHGYEGGSLAWVPKHGHEKCLFSVRGKNHFVLTDIVLPVAELYRHQRSSSTAELTRATAESDYILGRASRPPDSARGFKTLAPNFFPPV